ncbi:uncharacterized protein LACBIDRAFT_317372 [Laccaria bicolor S238N-H82]|uniref:Predicted protein n=1 Tax=Laccaria bicolor (strain S238N-H82 / ATCC MYA-4686) TaxID=486041 RepID=B0D516_LACBS|nr:uncharacterized protein LACBIDRAFT_317372 [Laccaria bicolor S238N-H82]EDR10441.1 predicted protein [Laccaria bicolor S238N-H82]|eukprot:XP_001878891.1 predicted protein [Laccaria bicolor S238N-H82]
MKYEPGAWMVLDAILLSLGKITKKMTLKRFLSIILEIKQTLHHTGNKMWCSHVIKPIKW